MNKIDKQNEEYMEEKLSLEDIKISEELDFGKDFINDEESSTKVNKKKKYNPHKGHRDRMYKRFSETGFEGFHEHEVLEMLLYLGIPQKDTNLMAHNLIKDYGNLSNVLSADINDLIASKVPERAALIITQYRELLNYIRFHKPINVTLHDTDSAGEFCCEHFGYDVVEAFYIISLSTTRKVKAVTRISKGRSDRTDAYPAKILRVALRHDAHGVILCHNHPGGNLNPSSNDIMCTQQIIQLLGAVDIPVIDHIICYREKFTSLFERGYIHN